MVAKIRIRNSKAPLCGDQMFGHKRIKSLHTMQEVIKRTKKYIKDIGKHYKSAIKKIL
jgi:hypothetical protein